jgi:hypothetical protein
LSIPGTKDQRDARADLKKDGRPILYVFPAPPVDPVLGEPPSGGGVQVPTWGITETAQTRIGGGNRASSLAEASIEVTVPAIDFIPTPPVAGGTFYLAPSGQKDHPVVPGAPGVRALRMTTLYDAPADGVDEILYIALATGDGPPRPS